MLNCFIFLFDQINGHVVYDNKRTLTNAAEQVILEIICENGICNIEMPYKFNLRLDKVLHINVFPAFRPDICGLCGGSSYVDRKYMKGPDNCLYTDFDLFVTSWTIDDGVGCQKSKLRKWKKKQKRYQKRCPKMI